MCQCRYTSKIRDFGDLDHLESYGFRGEALSSLCTLSQVTVTTKTKRDDLAKTYSFDSNGNVISSRISHLNLGTIITVQGLFKNLPVRKQFLTSGKRKTQELNSVANIVKSFGLIHPSLRIVLHHNKFRIWQKSAVSSVQECLVQVIPHTVSKNLYEINHSEGNLTIQLMVPSKECYVWNTCYGLAIEPINVFVNSRPVKNKQIEKAVQEEIYQFFGSTIPKNKNPFCLVAITLPTNCVDVNLEPNKTKVIIKDLECVVKVLKDQLVLYYVGALEPPKPSTDENHSDSGLKRKNTERTPVKTKVAKKTNKIETESPNKSLNESENSNIDETVKDSVHIKDTSLFHAQIKVPSSYLNVLDNEKNSSDAMISLTTLNHSENNMCRTEIEVGNDSLNFNENLDDLVPVLDQIATDLSGIKRSELITKDVTVSIDEVKKKINSGEELVGIMSNDDSSADSFTTEILQKLSEDFKRCSNGDTDCVMKTSTQKEVAECNENEVEKKNNIQQTSINMNEITISQWSRGDVKINGQVIESSVKIGKENFLKRKLENNPSCSPNTSQLSERSISSQMGCKQLSGFTKFAKEMRSKIIQQTPGITFTAVAAELASRWRDLQEHEQKMYDDKAKDKQEKPKLPKMPVKLKDPIYRPNLVSIRYNPSSSEVKVKKIVKNTTVELTIDKLKTSLDKRINYQAPSRNLITTLQDNVLLIKEDGNIISASLERIKEAIELHNNLEQIKITSKVLDTRVPIFQSDLGPGLWSILGSLESNFDDTFKSIIVIIDERITINGFRIEKIPGIQENEYYITDVPSQIEGCGLNEFKEILQFISINHNVKLKDCRPKKILNYVKRETLKCNNTLNSHIFMDNTNVLDMYRYWSENLKGITRNCPHYRPVCKLLFPVY
ncbi:PMS1 protein homolog 1-like isoform X2 [Rhodnius prolixus]